MPLKAYDITFKIKAIRLAEQKGNRPAAAELHVDERRIREWRQQKRKLEELLERDGSSSKRRRLDGGGRKLLHPEVEEDLAMWIVAERQQMHRVTRKGIALHAEALIREEGFKASRGWISRFLHRHGFVTRMKTTTGQRLPPEVTSKVASFVTFCQQQREQHHLLPCHMGNMDETAIWADMPGTFTVEEKGAQHVPILSTGHEKSRITVCLSAMADGRKLTPMIVFKGKKMPPELKDVTGVVIALSHNGWMNPETTIRWITDVWGTLAFHERMLVWDSYRCHLTADVRSALKKTRSLIAVIPGGCTKVLQPADVSWNAPFKAAFREKYEEWLHAEERQHDKTGAGNPRAPSRRDMALWVKFAWDQVSTDVVKNSFDACGITTADPDKIHCTKRGNIAENAREALSSAAALHPMSIDLVTSIEEDAISLSDGYPEDDDDAEVDLFFEIGAMRI